MGTQTQCERPCVGCGTADDVVDAQPFNAPAQAQQAQHENEANNAIAGYLLT